MYKSLAIKRFREKTEVWTVGLHYDFRAFDNSPDHWKIVGCGNRTAFLLGVTTGLFLLRCFYGCVTIELLSKFFD
ncbi:hypothetical protein BBG03_06495 [Streptococcus dysgalactiae subsp. equisimilis]|nr:hypothetical protein BBG03_06495 [Streptococcus dysgalactiae subsp. equisimilis]OBZ05000.1 hypothetical protein BBG04_06015 [Streptococcus dysgalactiae subsp. equisimilis]OCX03816.1 hypothetical protein BBG07_03665 [Streptococcus dysgalactiae subsp. equisimilis]BAN93859.1 cobalamin (vitamin B12) biosynthesis protein [Streptococcus dysgalactiae subsp. equisimilis 167]